MLGFVEFNPGQRYTDFDPNLYNVAAYGTGERIAGKAATKAELLKMLLVFLGLGKKNRRAAHDRPRRIVEKLNAKVCVSKSLSTWLGK